LIQIISGYPTNLPTPCLFYNIVADWGIFIFFNPVEAGVRAKTLAPACKEPGASPHAIYEIRSATFVRALLPAGRLLRQPEITPVFGAVRWATNWGKTRTGRYCCNGNAISPRKLGLPLRPAYGPDY
jgi:hypothetical protein